MQFFSLKPLRERLSKSPEKKETPKEEPSQKEAKTAEETKTADERQLQLWKTYKFGDEEHEPGDKKVRAQLMGEFARLMHQVGHETRKAGAPMAAGRREARQAIYSAIERFDPEKGKLSSWVFSNLYPNGPGSTSKPAQKAISHLAGAKMVTDSRLGLVPEVRRQAQDFENMHGRPPSNEELADIMKVPAFEIQKARWEGAPEYDPQMSINEDENAADLSLRDKDAIRAVYADQDEAGKKLMEFMFPGVFNVAPPPVRFGAGGAMHMAQQLGVSHYTVSRKMRKIREEIQRATRRF